MGDWNAATVIIALVILAVFLWIVIHGIRKRKQGGGCSCGGNCGACGGCCLLYTSRCV